MEGAPKSCSSRASSGYMQGMKRESSKEAVLGVMANMEISSSGDPQWSRMDRMENCELRLEETLAAKPWHRGMADMQL